MNAMNITGANATLNDPQEINRIVTTAQWEPCAGPCVCGGRICARPAQSRGPCQPQGHAFSAITGCDPT